ncbi:MAG: phosphatidate cytidylyltransferase [Treponema sp.]|jgi:phosphatidate cytidylyltransferase|nr:phosphatidate cytidylyltransferase [Treponema sp.]
MKKLTERLLIFFIGVPVFFIIIIFLPFYKHLVFNILVTFFSAAGAVELSAMFEKKQLHVSKTEAFIFGSLAPLAATLTVCVNLPKWIVPLLIMAGVMWILLSKAFTSQAKMDNVINNIAAAFSVIAYPSFFLYWLVKMSIWENSGAIFLFLAIAFLNDSTAWLAGNLFGENNRGIIPASPNKSIAGFSGGLLVSIIIPAGTAILFPSVFSVLGNPVLLVKAIILGVFTSIFASLGDLSESAIKRSCDFKNSGSFFLERGGILDSIDSVSIAAPVFYFLYTAFFFTA